MLTAVRRSLLVPQRYSNRFSSNPFPLDKMVLSADLWNYEQQGFCLSYDDNDYLKKSVADYRIADSAGAIEAWVETKSTVAYDMILSSGDEGSDDNYIQFRIGAGIVGFLASIAGVVNQVTSTNTINDGKHHHIVLSTDGSTWVMFIDGVAETLIIIGSNTGDWFADVPNRDNIMIGALQILSGLTHYMIGRILPVRVYSRVMGQAEAQTNYQRGWKAAPSDTTGLVSYWKMDEGSGTTAADSAGTDDLTITGATWVESLMDRSTNAFVFNSYGNPTWSNKGRTFLALGDGLIQAQSPNFGASLFDGGGTLIAWIKPSAAGQSNIGRVINKYGPGAATDGWAFATEDNVGGSLRFSLYHFWSGATSLYDRSDYVLPLDTWKMISATYNSDNTANRAILYVNDATTPVNAVENPLGTRDTDVAANLSLGNNDAQANDFAGIIGEVRGCRRILSLAEIIQVFNATRWRYEV